jgi:hypothetical protein
MEYGNFEVNLKIEASSVLQIGITEIFTLLCSSNKDCRKSEVDLKFAPRTVRQILRYIMRGFLFIFPPYTSTARSLNTGKTYY